MNKVSQRLLVFFIGVPFIILLVTAGFWHNFLLHMTILFFSVSGAIEMYDMLKRKIEVQPFPLVIFLTAIIPISEYISIVLNLSEHLSSLAFVASIMIIMAKEIFSYDRETGSFEKAIFRMCSTSFIVFYTGYLFSFISKMGSWEEVSIMIAVFLLFVFGCDSIAWFFGVLFGKNNKNIFKASPNKSIAGYFGGFAGPLLIAYVVWYFIPFLHEQSLLHMLIIAFFTSLTSITGDLVESVIKRSAGCKDSGKLIPGRGGILDSIDSILFSAPLFYLLCEIFFGF